MQSGNCSLASAVMRTPATDGASSNSGAGSPAIAATSSNASSTVRASGPTESSDVASGTTWSAVSTPAASWSSPTLTVPVASAIGGSDTLTASNASPALTATTAALTLTSNSGAIEDALEAAINAQSGWSAAAATVTQTGAGKYNITAKATNSTTVYTLTLAVTSSLTGPAGYSGELAFTGAGVDTLLGTESQVTTTLEVQCTDSSKVQTFLQVPCLLRKVID